MVFPFKLSMGTDVNVLLTKALINCALLKEWSVAEKPGDKIVAQ